jgi:hypothetical protein
MTTGRGATAGGVVAEPGGALDRVFKDPDEALTQLVAARRQLDIANQHVDEREHATSRMVAEAPDLKRRDQAVAQGQMLKAALQEKVSRALASHDIAFAVYQEAARARDANASNGLAQSNERVSRRIAQLSVVLAIAAAVQTIAMVAEYVHTWSAK